MPTLAPSPALYQWPVQASVYVDGAHTDGWMEFLNLVGPRDSQFTAVSQELGTELHHTQSLINHLAAGGQRPQGWMFGSPQ